MTTASAFKVSAFHASTDISRQVDSAIGTIDALKKSVEDVYTRRVSTTATAFEKWAVAHPGLVDLCASGPVVGALVIGIGAIGLGFARVFALEPACIAGLIAMGTGLAIAKGFDAIPRRDVANVVRKAPLAREDLVGFERVLQRLTTDERCLVRNYVQSWTEGEATDGRVGPETKSSVLTLVDCLPTNTLEARVGEAAALVSTARSLCASRKFGELKTRLESLLESTPEAERLDFATTLRQRWFAGDDCRIPYIAQADKYELYALLDKYSIVRVSVHAD